MRLIAPYLDADTDAALADPAALDQHCQHIMREAADTLMRVEAMAWPQWCSPVGPPAP